MSRTTNTLPAFSRWLTHDQDEQSGSERTSPWWKVMCLTGVDYFSSLGYQPGIAIAAAGAVAPIATVVLVLLTLFGALPVYRRVAAESPHGEGSIHLLEHLLPKWSGKLFVLVLLGFAATDFMITITLSSADAAAHLVGNPLVPESLHGTSMIMTVIMILLLGAVFLRGFGEAIGIAVALVFAYVSLNIVILAKSLYIIASHPQVFHDWTRLLSSQHNHNWLLVIAIALLVFPKLALGMSGFETGVAVMPQIASGLPQRVQGAHKLLTVSALLMSIMLLMSSVSCTLLIPASEFGEHGSANGRALAYHAHELLGNGFGTVYDVATILILWFAGASAMAGLLNLVSRYLPRYGMAPEWARLTRPLTLVFATIALLITWVFDANVEAQGSAYATGALVLMTSGAFAVALHQRVLRNKGAFAFFSAIAVVFLYTTLANVIERPDGVKVAGAFIGGIVLVSLASRVFRAFELRANDVVIDSTGMEFIKRATRMAQKAEDRQRRLVLIAHDPEKHSFADYVEKETLQRKLNRLPRTVMPLFVEISVVDSTEFSADLVIRGIEREGFPVLSVEAPSVGNSMAAILLYLRDLTGVIPEVHFEWYEGDPFLNFLRFLFLGVGENAMVTQQVLRRAEKDVLERPRVYVV